MSYRRQKSRTTTALRSRLQKPQGFLVLLKSFFSLALPSENTGQVFMDFSDPRLNLQSFLKVFHCFIKAILLRVDLAQVEVGLGIVGINSESFAKLLYRLVDIAPAQKQKAKVVMH